MNKLIISLKYAQWGSTKETELEAKQSLEENHKTFKVTLPCKHHTPERA
jgi:hypothetical protein